MTMITLKETLRVLEIGIVVPEAEAEVVEVSDVNAEPKPGNVNVR